MSFWYSQTGPQPDGDPRGDGTAKAIGTVACPDCEGVLGRLLEADDGVGLRVWVPAPLPGRPDTKDVGYELWAWVRDDEPGDEEGAVLNCWQGHTGLWVTGALCRQLVDLYRDRGRPSRRLASRVPEDRVES